MSKGVFFVLFSGLLTATLVGLGCTDDGSSEGPDGETIDDAAFDYDVTVSEVIPTVATVEWSVDLDELQDAYVEFGTSTDYGKQAPVDVGASQPYETLLLGIKPNAEVHFRIVVEADGQTVASADATYDTGSAPSNLPDTDVSVNDAGNAGGFLVTSLFTAPTAAVIIDRDGDYVWWYVPDDDASLSRARLSVDGTGMWLWTLNVIGPQGGTGTDGGLLWVSLDGTQTEQYSTNEGHHDFVELPDGTLAYLEYDTRTVDNQEVDGDRIIEVTPGGGETEVYSIWDDIEYSGGGGGGPGTTFSHLNALDYDVEQDAFYFSSLGLGGLFKVDRASGTLDWVLGGSYSDFDDSSLGTSLFTHQHQFERVGSSMLVFDNGDEQRGYSQAVEFELDESSGQADLIWSYLADPQVFSFSLGDVHRFDSGNTMVTFSTGGQIDELDADGDLVWRMNLSLGGATGYMTPVDSLYP